MPESSVERSLHAKTAVYVSWANTPDRSARTAAGRRAADARFERQVDPDGVMLPAERAKRADAARQAHYLSMSLKAAKARRLRAEGGGDRRAAK